MRVLRFVSLASRGGRYGGPFDSARAQMRLAAKAGCEVIVLAGSFEGDSPAGDVETVTVPVRHLLGLGSFLDVGSLRLVRELRKSIRSADVVHVSLAREFGPLMASVLAVIMRRPLIMQPHGMLTTSRRRLPHVLIDALLVKPLAVRCKTVLALTGREKNELLCWEPRLSERVVVLGNPPLVDTSMSSDQHQHPEYLADALFAARLHQRKRVMDFAEAAEFAEESGWKDRYVVLGPDEGDLGALSRAERSIGNLEYAGSTDSSGVLERLERSRVFVLCSNDEPWGNVLVSALCLGKPVVVSSSSALAPEVQAASAGVVFPDGDSRRLAEAVHYLLEEENYVAYSKRASALASARFSSKRMQKMLLTIYEQAASAL